jgi:hypothetical protein
MAGKRRSRGHKLTRFFRSIFTLLAFSVLALGLGYAVGHVAVRTVTKQLLADQSLAVDEASPGAEDRDAPSAGNAVQPAGAAGVTAPAGTAPAVTAPAPQAATQPPTAAPVPQEAVKQATLPAAVKRPEAPVPGDVRPDAPADSTKGAAASEEAVPALAPAREAVEEQQAVSPTSTVFWRVRIGRYNTREAAEADLHRVQLSVPEAIVVHDGVFRIQAGAFSERQRAEMLATELSRRGFTADISAP